GISISPDSVSYLSTSESLQAGLGFVMYDGEPMVLWPPLFPLVIAILKTTGLDPVHIAGLFNALTVAVGTFFVADWLLKNTSERGVALLGITLAVFSLPIIHVASWLWTEPLFVMFTVLCLILLSRKAKGKRTTRIGAVGVLTA